MELVEPGSGSLSGGGGGGLQQSTLHVISKPKLTFPPTHPPTSSDKR